MAETFAVVSFGSEQPDRYAQGAQRMEQRCRELQLECDIRVIPFPPKRGTAITLHKPTFIANRIADLQKTVLWLDCDASLEAAPRLPDGEWDIGFVPNTVARKRNRRPFSAFAIAVRPSPEALHFLSVWRYLCAWEGLSPRWDHQRMCWAWQMCSDLKVVNIAGGLVGAVIRDKGNPKEHDLVGLEHLTLSGPDVLLNQDRATKPPRDHRIDRLVRRFLRGRSEPASAEPPVGSARSGLR